MSTMSAAITLFLIMDPLGNVPIFLNALERVEPERQRTVLIRELLIAYVILCFFLFFGGYLLTLMGLRTESISVGGGIVLFLIAIKMIFPSNANIRPTHNPDEEPFIVPLAIPSVAGPSTMASLVIMAKTQPGQMLGWFTALTGAWIVSSMILLSSPFIFRVLKKRGLIAVERLMGMILVSLSVQLFLDGVSQYLSK